MKRKRKRNRGRFGALVLLLALALFPCAACQWLQNEFFTLDVAAPPQGPETTRAAPW